MSEPDAVPLPREGEVFFDVRGEARCMRLSWYADSRVAVFSIWQGHRCTGTFRLPFADLARMVQTLQSGPRARAQDPGDGRRQGGRVPADLPRSQDEAYGYPDRDALTSAMPADPSYQPDAGYRGEAGYPSGQAHQPGSAYPGPGNPAGPYPAGP